MKFRILLFTLIILSFAFPSHAQNRNPYQSIGKKGKVITLTQGRYEESFDDDSIQQIGTALVNVRTMQIVKLELSKEEQRVIDETAVSRFLSVDPLTKNFPMLTPYQYASNRPIDGIDMDGLEYITYTFNIDLGKRTTDNYGNKSVGQITNSSYTWYNANQHNAHGDLGQGVQYKINYYGDNKLIGSDAFFVSRNATAMFGAVSTEYGNYMGATSLFKLNSDGHSFTKEYDYSLPAVDQVDFLAMNHDKGYDALNAVGKNSLFNDWGTTPVDEAALNGWNTFREKYTTGSKDPYNGQTVTSGERDAAWRGATLFDDVVSSKKADISYWMQSNYGSEAASHTNKGMYGAKDMQQNYNLFLQKHMNKDSNGNWTRKDGMWTRNENGDWNPNKPKQ